MVKKTTHRTTYLTIFIFVSLMLVSMNITRADEVKIIQDPEDDVVFVDMYGDETVTNEKPNIDIIEVQYLRVGQQVSMSLTVKGVIENQGFVEGSINIVQYNVLLATNEHQYRILYLNKTCEFFLDSAEPTNIPCNTINDNTLVVQFALQSTSETYNFSYAYTTDYNFLSRDYYYDEADDLPLQVMLYFSYHVSVGEEIHFYGIVYGGTQPYTYLWDFGDGNSSSEQFPTHAYSHIGNYTVTLTVTDAKWVSKQATATAYIREVQPLLMFQWTSDDGGIAPSQSQNDGVIEQVPSILDQPLNISFRIMNGDGQFYGAEGTFTQAVSNITISGDALFLQDGVKKLQDYPGKYGYQARSSRWYIWLTPVMNLNGGHITISAYWQGYGTTTAIDSIGGDLSGENGCIVTISPSRFFSNTDVTVVVTVKDPTGGLYRNADVQLYWVNNTGPQNGHLYRKIAERNGGGNSAGEYIFHLNTSQYLKNQKTPRYLCAYVEMFSVGNGYAITKMEPVNTSFKKTFIVGRFTNMSTDGDLITIQAVNLRMVQLKPFEYQHVHSHELIAFSNQYKGLLTKRLIIGMFNVVS